MQRLEGRDVGGDVAHGSSLRRRPLRLRREGAAPRPPEQLRARRGQAHLGPACRPQPPAPAWAWSTRGARLGALRHRGPRARAGWASRLSRWALSPAKSPPLRRRGLLAPVALPRRPRLSAASSGRAPALQPLPWLSAAAGSGLRAPRARLCLGGAAAGPIPLPGRASEAQAGRGLPRASLPARWPGCPRSPRAATAAAGSLLRQEGAGPRPWEAPPLIPPLWPRPFVVPSYRRPRPSPAPPPRPAPGRAWTSQPGGPLSRLSVLSKSPWSSPPAPHPDNGFPSCRLFPPRPCDASCKNSSRNSTPSQPQAGPTARRDCSVGGAAGLQERGPGIQSPGQGGPGQPCPRDWGPSKGEVGSECPLWGERAVDQAPDPHTPPPSRGERRAWAAGSQPGHVAFAVPRTVILPGTLAHFPARTPWGWGGVSTGSPLPWGPDLRPYRPGGLASFKETCLSPDSSDDSPAPDSSFATLFLFQRLRGHPRSSVSISGEHPLPPMVLRELRTTCPQVNQSSSDWCSRSI